MKLYRDRLTFGINAMLFAQTTAAPPTDLNYYVAVFEKHWPFGIVLLAMVAITFLAIVYPYKMWHKVNNDAARDRAALDKEIKEQEHLRLKEIKAIDLAIAKASENAAMSSSQAISKAEGVMNHADRMTDTFSKMQTEMLVALRSVSTADQDRT